MSNGISFSGLSSGIDTATIIEQLIAIDRRPITLLQNKSAEEGVKLEILQTINSSLLNVLNSAEAISTRDAFDVFSAKSSDSDVVDVSTTGSASPGSFSVEVLSLAQAQSRSSASFTSATDALGLSGDFIINGKTVSLDSGDSLLDIQGAINDADSGVQAQILTVSSTDHRLLITSEETGEEGFSLLDASATDVLQSLGLNGSSTSIKNALANGAESELFAGATTAVGTLLGLDSAPSGTVTIGDQTVAIDLATMSLDDIKAAIDAAAPAGVTTSIDPVEDEFGTNRFKLSIDGTTTFVDDGNVLEALGILSGSAAAAPAVAEVHTSATANTTDGTTALTASDNFADVFGASASNGDTISISGTAHDGTAVSGTYTINNVNANTIQDLLDEIETVFGGGVTASIDASGQLQVTDNTTGVSQLSVTVQANNEGGGTLDFGSLSATTVGEAAQSREVVAGQDATFKVNGVTLSRSTNTVTDALAGVTLTLNSAQIGQTVNVSIARDTGAIRSKIEQFVSDYNTAATLVDAQFVFDEESQSSGPLSGDATLLTLQSRLRQVVTDPVLGLAGNANSLTLFGVEFNREGKLEIDQTKLNNTLSTNLTALRRIFTGEGAPSDGDIEFVSMTDDTGAGTYDVNITAAAEQATVTGGIDLSAGAANAFTLTITDLVSNKSESIDIAAGETTDDIVSKINTALASSVAEVKTGSVANTTDGATPITAATTFDSLFGAGVVAGDTIDIQGTTHTNERVSGTFTIDDPTTQTVGDLLSDIQSIYGGTVSASINANGEIVVTDSEVGNSSMTLVLIERNEGGGSLNFGGMDTSTQGRFSMSIDAENDGGFLKLTSEAYGNSAGFQISQSTNETGITDTEYRGVDVAGTINGEAATGRGRVLTGNSDSANVAGLSIRSTLTAAQLLVQGSDQGAIKITLGVGEQLRRTLEAITDPFEGLIATRQQAVEDTIQSNDDQIASMEERLSIRRQTLQRQFTAMETSVAELNSLGAFLGSQLAGLAAQNS